MGKSKNSCTYFLSVSHFSLKKLISKKFNYHNKYLQSSYMYNYSIVWLFFFASILPTSLSL